MPRHVKLAFGRHGAELYLPDGFRYQVLEAKSATSLNHAAAAIADALDCPVSSLPLPELARGKRSAAISVCDITRPAPNRIVLPPVLERLERAGISRTGIVILIATGLHRPATDAEIREIVGEEIARNYRVENHDARELGQHRYLGTAPPEHPRGWTNASSRPTCASRSAS